MSHVISAWSATSSVHAQSRHQCMIATWSVHAQSGDLDLISHVIRACRVTWSGPAELRDSCLVTCLIIASWAAWFVTAELHAYCLLIAWFVSAQLFEYCLLRSLFGRHLPGTSPNWSRVFEGERLLTPVFWPGKFCGVTKSWTRLSDSAQNAHTEFINQEPTVKWVNQATSIASDRPRALPQSLWLWSGCS